jgi:GxxExxY protein
MGVQHQDITYRVIGCAMKVHNSLGPGLRELHYHRALSEALAEDGLSFSAQHPVTVTLDDARIGTLFLDHLVEDKVVVEEKALSHPLTSHDIGQVITYLAATAMPVGLLLNFGRRSLDYKRILPPRSVTDWRGRVARFMTPDNSIAGSFSEDMR